MVLGNPESSSLVSMFAIWQAHREALKTSRFISLSPNDSRREMPTVPLLVVGGGALVEKIVIAT